jgi:hypothetical protein
VSPSQRPPEDGEEDWFTAAPTECDHPAESSVPPLSVVANLPVVDPDEPDWFSTPATSACDQASEPAQSEPSAACEGTDIDDESNGDESEWFGGAAQQEGEFETRETEFLPREPAATAIPGPKTSWLRRNRSAVAVGIAVVALVGLIGGGTALVSAMSSTDETPTSVADVASSSSVSSSVATATTAALAAPVAPAAHSWCDGFAKGDPITPQSSDPGSAAIAGFEAAFYARDGLKARSFGAANTQLGSAEQIAAGAAQIPENTEHCVLASQAGEEGTYSVDIFERRPDGTSVQYRQSIVTTPAPDGSARIVAITTREGQ